MGIKIKSIICTAAAAAMCVTAAQAVSAETSSSPSASEVAKDMGTGWSLGNTFDATGGTGVSSETSWGNPKTTKAMIDTVKAAGFNTVRIPVSWGKHTSGADYTIDGAWLARVKEVVDYCYDDGMYVILNIHHDTDKSYYYPSSAYLTQSIKYVGSIWSQLADEFADYDEHVIFETLNEPRLVGTNDEWWFNVNSPNSAVSDSIECINKLNQTAVDSIRAAGGYNKQRVIMCPGYSASLDGCSTAGFKLPTDSVKDKLIVSVHAYTPYNFALNKNGTSVFSDSLKSEVDNVFNTINNKYLSKGIPVVIGETSASNKSNSAERVKWARYFYGKSKTYGVPLVLWDNNVYVNKNDAGEAHGHLNRRALTWYDESFIKAIMNTLGIKGNVNNVDPVDISSKAQVSTVLNRAYTGSAIKPDVTVKYNGTTLENGIDYTVSYSNNINVGLASIKFTFTGDYTGTKTVTFKILPKAPVLSNPTVSASSVSLSWSKSVGASGYRVMRADKGQSNWKLLIDTSSTNYTDDTTVRGNSYSYKIYAYANINGSNALSAVSNVSDITLTMEKAVMKNTYTNAPDAIRIYWNHFEGAAGYRIYRYDTVTKKTVLAKEFAGTSKYVLQYSDTGLVPGRKYLYQVQAIDYQSKPYSARSTPLAAYTKPATVNISSNYTNTTNAIRINWGKAQGATGYIVYRWNGKSWSRLAKVGANVTTYRDSKGLIAGGHYKYRVQSFKIVGNTVIYGNYSATKTAATKPAKLKITAKKANGSYVMLSWDTVKANGYQIYVYKNGKYQLLTTIRDANVNYFKSSDYNDYYTTYKFRIRAFRYDGTGAQFGDFQDVSVNRSTMKKTMPKTVASAKVETYEEYTIWNLGQNEAVVWSDKDLKVTVLSGKPEYYIQNCINCLYIYSFTPGTVLVEMKWNSQEEGIYNYVTKTKVTFYE